MTAPPPVSNTAYDAAVTERVPSGSDAVASNEALVRRVFDDVVNARDLPAADEICTPDAVITVPGMRLSRGPEGLREFARSLHDGFDDIHVVIDDLIATEDGVAARWHTDRQTHTGVYRGIPPTGRSVRTTGNNLYRIKDGRIRAAWVEADSVGLAQQLGVVPPDDLSAGRRVVFMLGTIIRLAYLQATASRRSRT